MRDERVALLLAGAAVALCVAAAVARSLPELAWGVLLAVAAALVTAGL